MEVDRQTLETKRKILHKLKKLLDQWNSEFHNMDPDVREYFNTKVDKNLKHVHKDLRAYFEMLSKEFEKEERDYKKMLKAYLKAARQRTPQVPQFAEEETTTLEEFELYPNNNNNNNRVGQTTRTESSNSSQEPNGSHSSGTSRSRRRRPTQTPSLRGTRDSGIADMYALFQEAIVDCKTVTRPYDR